MKDGIRAAERLRVLHVALDLEAGGLEKLIVALVRGVDRSRFEPGVLVVRTPGRYAEDLVGHAPVTEVGPQGRLALLRPLALSRKITQFRPQLVHTHSGVWFKATRAARMAGVERVVHTDHGRPSPDPWLDRAMDRLASRRTDVVIAVSDALAGQLRRTVVAPTADVRVIVNGVNTNAFRPDLPSPKDLRQFGDDRVLIGTVGRLDPIKGYDVMIEAFAILRTRLPDTRVGLLIVGDGPERVRLERLAHERDLERCIHFTGWRMDVARIYAMLRIFCLSSYSEGTSVSLLEAMSAGCCPVVTGVGGNPAVLGPDLAHRLVPPGDAGALAAAWEAALRDPNALERDARAARRRIRAQFDEDGMVVSYERLYEELVHGRG